MSDLRIASNTAFCPHCVNRVMAMTKFNYATEDLNKGFISIDYRCLQCGHEETQDFPSEAKPSEHIEGAEQVEQIKKDQAASSPYSTDIPIPNEAPCD